MTRRPQESKDTKLFLVRLWSERFDGGRRTWRGEVVRAGSDSRQYFARWSDLLAFLCKETGVTWEGHVDKEITTEVMAE